TEAQLLASIPILKKKAAKALNTGKVWLWENGTWKDTGLSELDQAKTHATSKADAAQAAAISAAEKDATSKADAAQAAAIPDAEMDATSNADAAQAAAISAAEKDATSKADAAQAAAISAAKEDATSKAEAALDQAKLYADSKTDSFEKNSAE